MKTLAIETSCDDTSVGIVSYDPETGKFTDETLLSYAQIAAHQPHGGVVPEIASREHADKIIALVKEIGRDSISTVDQIAVTSHPGLPGSLVVGKAVAATLRAHFDKPLRYVNHIYGHIFSILLDRKLSDIVFPYVVLTASGGHNDLYLVDKNPREIIENRHTGESNMTEIMSDDEVLFAQYKITRIGHTLDDAAGEAFDKVSRMLGGPYPGGAWIGQQATKGKPNDQFAFKRIFLSSKEYNFSFSGMKSQMHYLLDDMEKRGQTLTDDMIADIAYEFQEAMVEVLAKKLIRAAIEYGANTVGLVGGVSANDRLWQYLEDYKSEKMKKDVMLYKPTKKVYSTDNAAMIGVVGLLQDISGL